MMYVCIDGLLAVYAQPFRSRLERVRPRVDTSIACSRNLPWRAALSPQLTTTQPQHQLLS